MHYSTRISYTVHRSFPAHLTLTMLTLCLHANINLLKVNNNVNSQLYLETVYSNGFSQQIGKATRINGDSFSLIDHILTKSNDNISRSGVILSDISDHFITFISVKKHVKENVPQFVYRRDMSQMNINNFKESLRMLRWQNVLNSNDANESYNLFWEDFNVLYELHFPLKKVKFNLNYHKVKGYMTSGLLTSRRRKLELQKKSLLNPTVYLESYKLYRNVYNSLVRASKKMYIDDNF
jgi:hypothetical protein